MKMICYDLFYNQNIFFFLAIFVHIKVSYYWFNRLELLLKAKDKYHNCGEKKAAKHYLENKDVIKKKQKQIISIKIFQKKKSKQKRNMEEIGIKI